MTDQNARVLDQFSQQAQAYAALASAQQAQAQGDPLIDLIAPQPGHRLLDVGCGTGQFAVAMAPLVAEVVGVDLTPAMLRQAQALASAAKRTNIRWQNADSVALPFEDGSFDVVVSRAMFHHAADPAATLAEMHRACARNGRIFVFDVAPDPAKAPAFDAMELLRDPSHKRALLLEELRQLGRDEGLREIAVQVGPMARMSLEAVLATSFPPEGMRDHVRSLLARDAATGLDIFGMQAENRNGELWISYPTMMIGWSPA